MAPPVTLFRFQIEVSDVDRNLYESLDFRAAQHPSESLTYLVTRVLAYVLSLEDGLAFTPNGLSDPDAPALRSPDENGGTKTWIEIGNPSARKLHKASKAARVLRVFTYKDPEHLLREARGEKVHRAEAIEIYSLAPKFLLELENGLERHNVWQVIHNEGSLIVNFAGQSAQTELKRHQI